MNTQIMVVIGSLVGFTVLAFFFYRSINNLEKKKTSKKKGRTKYMPQAKNKF
ncbi:MAG TPA: hypothetical protein VIO64_03110 [Pseudobacteroides sp.]|uniref:hypothetical protein n=1 Tax=Pseudobacteroides sp. TaxID=1968840 RepID=UPI002F955072